MSLFPTKTVVNLEYDILSRVSGIADANVRYN